MPAVVEVYRNLTRLRWSVRVGRWVAAHMTDVALRDVTFRSSEASRLRTLRTGVRDVHAWARGVPAPGLFRPADAVRIRYRPRVEPGFRDPDGELVAGAAFAWFEADGTLWAVDLVPCMPEPHHPIGRHETTGAHHAVA